MEKEMKRSIILDHYQSPRNKGLTNDSGYIKINMNNESCIDEVNLEVRIENDVIKDVKFDGDACAMCISSSSIMTDTLIGKTKEEAVNILNNFFSMIDEKEYNADVLEEAIVYDDVYKQPNRKKCVLLSWWGMENIMKENNNK